MEGKNVEELIKEGLEKLVSIPTGPTPATSIASVGAAEEEKKEEEEDIDMSGGGLFGDDDDW